MKRVAVLNVVGLSESLLGTSTPHLNSFRARNVLRRIRPAFPAVTCTAQANYLTGKLPTDHGIVGNGWYHRELAEVQFWKQSNRLVSAPKIWDTFRIAHPQFTCAQLFWWYNMYSSADWSITPRPMYPADGRKVFDIYAWPYEVRAEIKRELGEFPFPAFWGPAAGVESPQFRRDAVSQWIAYSARWMELKNSPSLSLVYLPHLDYNLQRLGPAHPEIAEDLRRIDAIVGGLIDFYESRDVQVVVLSEYGISAVDTPVHLNRIFRKNGWLAVKDELGRDYLDAGASRVFAVADHQIAHVYLNDPSLEKSVRAVLEATPGVSKVLGAEEKKAAGLDHLRAGDLVIVAQDRAWFTYYYWLDEARSPDFAPTIDIHRKPGYDPVELFINPALRFPKLRIVWRLLQKKLGFRMLMDVVSTDATLVKGSHGACPSSTAEWPVILGPEGCFATGEDMASTDVFLVLKRCVEG